MYKWLLVSTLTLLCLTCELCGFQLTIMHTTDVHAKILEIEEESYVDCSEEDSELDKCQGGQARLKTKITQQRAKHPDSILVDAGNQFTGSLFFYIFGGKLLARFMNAMGYDSMTLGIHDFDRGATGLNELLTRVGFDIVVTNIDVSEEEELEEIKKSTVLYIRGQEIGIVGYLTPMAKRQSHTDRVEFDVESRPGSEGVEAIHCNIKFLDTVDSVQKEVDRLTERGINKIVALGHAGYAKDMEYARMLNGVDVIVGGHDHELLYTGTPPSTEKAAGPYPTVITNRWGRKVLVVNAFAWGKYLGILHVDFDEEGVVRSWGGNPVLLDKGVPKDYGTLEIVKEYLPKLNALKNDIRGQSKVNLAGDRTICRVRECVIGNLVADAMVSYHQNLSRFKSLSPVFVALVPSAMFRLRIAAGEIPVADVLQAIPFMNTVDRVTLTGNVIKQALEHSAAYYVALGKGLLFGGFLQISGLKVVYDAEQRPSKRLVSVYVKCHDCRYPSFEKLNLTKVYPVVVASSLITGIEGYSMLKANIRGNIIRGPRDTDIVLKYMETHSPLFPTVEGRIQFLHEVKTHQICPSSRSSQVTKPSPLLLLSIVIVNVIAMLRLL